VNWEKFALNVAAMVVASLVAHRIAIHWDNTP